MMVLYITLLFGLTTAMQPFVHNWQPFSVCSDLWKNWNSYKYYDPTSYQFAQYLPAHWIQLRYIYAAQHITAAQPNLYFPISTIIHNQFGMFILGIPDSNWNYPGLYAGEPLKCLTDNGYHNYGTYYLLSTPQFLPRSQYLAPENVAKRVDQDRIVDDIPKESFPPSEYKEQRQDEEIGSQQLREATIITRGGSLAGLSPAESDEHESAENRGLDLPANGAASDQNTRAVRNRRRRLLIVKRTERTGNAGSALSNGNDESAAFSAIDMPGKQQEQPENSNAASVYVGEQEQPSQDQPEDVISSRVSSAEDSKELELLLKAANTERETPSPRNDASAFVFDEIDFPSGKDGSQKIKAVSNNDECDGEVFLDAEEEFFDAEEEFFDAEEEFFDAEEPFDPEEEPSHESTVAPPESAQQTRILQESSGEIARQKKGKKKKKNNKKLTVVVTFSNPKRPSIRRSLEIQASKMQQQIHDMLENVIRGVGACSIRLSGRLYAALKRAGSHLNSARKKVRFQRRFSACIREGGRLINSVYCSLFSLAQFLSINAPPPKEEPVAKLLLNLGIPVHHVAYLLNPWRFHGKQLESKKDQLVLLIQEEKDIKDALNDLANHIKLLDSNIGTWSTKFPPQIENAVRAQLLPDEVDAKLLLKIFQKRKKKLQHVDMNLPAWLTVEELPVAREILKRYKITFNSTIY